jgi:hypothetical protein
MAKSVEEHIAGIEGYCDIVMHAYCNDVLAAMFSPHPKHVVEMHKAFEAEHPVAYHEYVERLMTDETETE